MMSVHEGTHKGCPYGKAANWKKESTALLSFLDSVRVGLRSLSRTARLSELNSISFAVRWSGCYTPTDVHSTARFARPLMLKSSLTG